MILKNIQLKRFTAGLLIVAVLVPSITILTSPKQAEAQFGGPVFDVLTETNTGLIVGTNATKTAIAVKDVLKAVANEILKSLAKRALASITKSTVNWINSGFHGAPLFLQNPDSFLKDITKTQIKDLISTIGYDPIRMPFGKQQALNIISAYKTQLSDNLSYSLSNVTNDPTLLYNYQHNFNTGGWNVFMLNTQYPQNNYIGSQMQINDQLAQQLQGTIQAPAQKINTLLQQGQGFLSPQTCPSNPAYNNLTNEFQKPTFTFKPPADLGAPPNPNDFPDFTGRGVDDPNSLYNQALTAYNNKSLTAFNAQETDWAKANTCPGGLVNTTPGSVVANSIMTSLSSGSKLTELQAALGGSLSAVFNAILNKFLDKGLNALATTINPPPPADNFSYNGQTLGGPTGNDINGNTGDVFSTPDIVVVLDDFKKNIEDGITVTQEELNLMDNSDPSNPGVLQYMENIWPKTRELDMCVPGPNYGWEQRLSDETDRNVQVLQDNQPNPPPAGILSINQAVKNLQYASNFFKDWIKNIMILPTDKGGLGLPDSILFLDTINDIGNFSQNATELLNSRQDKRDALARLRAIEGGILSVEAGKPANATSDWPPDGSAQRQVLNDYKKQYDAIFPSISNASTLEDTKAQRDTLKDKFLTVSNQIKECNNERATEGWSPEPAAGWGKVSPGGADSFLNLSKIPSKFVLAYMRTLKIGPFNFPMLPTFGPASGSGQITIPGKNDVNPVFPYKVTGNEKEQFCDLPIAGGYSHYIADASGRPGFINGADPTDNGQNVLYPSIPLVNAGPLLVDRFTRLSCDIIYQSNPLDYKGDLPGPTNILNVNQLPENDTPLIPADTSGTNNTGGNNTNTGNTNPPPADCGTTTACG